MEDKQTFLSDELGNHSYRSKYFLLDDFHVGRATREYSGLNEIAFCSMLLATKMKSCTFCLAGFDVAHNALKSESSCSVETFYSMAALTSN